MHAPFRRGMIKLHVYHFILAFFSAMTMWELMSNVPAYSNTRYPQDNAFLISDFQRLHDVALPVIILDGITGGSAFIVFLVNAIRSQGLPLFAELTWVSAALVVQITNFILIERAHPRLIQMYKGGGTAGQVGADGKLSVNDAAADILVSWDFAIGTTAVLVIFLIGHLTWHLVVAFRHRQSRPRVLFEPISGSFEWNLKPAPPIAHNFPIVADGQVLVMSEKTSDLA